VIRVSDDIAIDESELAFRYSRSSGPGGQNVNKVATKVTLLFEVASSPSLSDEQKGRIAERLANRISRDGVLRVSSQRHRTQAANRRTALARFAELLADALRELPPRTRTRPPKKERKRRLQNKRHRSRVKALRSRPTRDD